MTLPVFLQLVVSRPVTKRHENYYRHLYSRTLKNVHAIVQYTTVAHKFNIFPIIFVKRFCSENFVRTVWLEASQCVEITNSISGPYIYYMYTIDVRVVDGYLKI